jgi:hypothetical protein
LKIKKSGKTNNKKGDLSMFPNYKKKLQTIIGMGLVAAFLSSLFSFIIIHLLLDIKNSSKNG